MVLQGRYAILERVAAGAMGVVYRGERVSLGRAVAVKFLHPWIAAQQTFRTRFETEARAMSRLSHPNCASVIDFGVEGTSPYVVMDFVAGVTLRQVMAQGRLAPARAVAIARQLLAGVAHAHAQNIIHRDLKPENLILGDTAGLADHVRILDFGLAKLRDGPAMTSGLALGTPSYMSPEQTGAPGDIDGRTDIYAVGVLLFEMLAGRKPFVSEKVAEILVMHRDTPPPRLREIAPDAGISAELEAVVDRALAKSPDARFQTAVELSSALARVPEGAASARSSGPFAVGSPPGAIQIGPSLQHPVNETVADPQHSLTVVALQPPPARPAVVPRGAAPGPAAAPAGSPAQTPMGLRLWLGLGALGVLALVLVAIGVRGRAPAAAGTPPATASTATTRPPGLPVRPPLAPSAGATSAPIPSLGEEPGPARGGPAPAPASSAAGSGFRTATHAVTVGARSDGDLSPPIPTGAPGEAAPPAVAVDVSQRFHEADGLLEKGAWEQALVVLEKARKENPRRAEAAYRLANTALEHRRWSEGAESARIAATEDPKYRSDERLVHNLIRALGSERGSEKGEPVLKGFGAGAVPFLKDAAAHDPSRIVRQRAEEILDNGRGAPSRPRGAVGSGPKPSSHPFFSR
jgi:hypothetical protein